MKVEDLDEAVRIRDEWHLAKSFKFVGTHKHCNTTFETPEYIQRLLEENEDAIDQYYTVMLTALGVEP